MKRNNNEQSKSKIRNKKLASSSNNINDKEISSVDKKKSVNNSKKRNNINNTPSTPKLLNRTPSTPKAPKIIITNQKLNSKPLPRTINSLRQTKSTILSDIINTPTKKEAKTAKFHLPANIKKSLNENTENFIHESWELINATKKQQVENVKSIIELNQLKYQSNLWLNERDQFGWAAIHYASFFGNLKICKVLTDIGGADINIQTSRGQETPLFLSAANNHYKLIDFFLSHKADVNIPDYTGKIALEVSYNESYFILSNERAKQNKIIRFIPTARKLLTNKFFQFLLQLLLCVFLEIFYDKLMVCFF